MISPGAVSGRVPEKMRLSRSVPLTAGLSSPHGPPSYPYFAILKDRLYRVTQDAQSKQDTTQLLVPKSRREMLFQAAHCNPMAGHLGQATTLNRLMARFFWPGIHENVRRWCAACRECQLVNPPASPKAPLRPPSAYAGPLRANWYGPHRAIRAVGTRASICISSGGLCNPIPRGSSAPQHFRKKCGGGSVQYDLPGGNPERDSHRPGHGVHVTGPFANFTDYWELNRFAPASITHIRTAWWNGLIVR